MNSSKEIVTGITEEIGADISYVRRKHGNQDAAYFTGIEIGILFGGTILANFLLGMLKGATEEVTTARGKAGRQDSRKEAHREAHTHRKSNAI